jgi:hypothetical protein
MTDLNALAKSSIASRLVHEWAGDRLTQPTAAERDFARWIVELLNHRTLTEVERALRRCCDLHRLSPAGSCCDPDDCGPCCPECPTCPTEYSQRLKTDHAATELLRDAHAAFESWYGKP